MYRKETCAMAMNTCDLTLTVFNYLLIDWNTLLDIQPKCIHCNVLGSGREKFWNSRTDVVVSVEGRVYSHERCDIGWKQVGLRTNEKDPNKW